MKFSSLWRPDDNINSLAKFPEPSYCNKDASEFICAPDPEINNILIKSKGYELDASEKDDGRRDGKAV